MQAQERNLAPGQYFNWLNLYEDTSAKLTASDLSLQLQYFKPLTQWPSLGETKSHLWLHVDFSEDRPNTEDIWIELGNPLTDYINLYQINSLPDGTTKTRLLQETGDARLFQSRGLPVRNFLLRLKNQEQQSYLIEIYGKSPMAIPIRIGEMSQLFNTMVAEAAFIYLLFGIMIAMTFYNGFLFIGTRISSYGWYSLYLASIFMFLVFSSGSGYQYLWNDSTLLQKNLGYGFIALFLLGAFAFTRDFLNIRERMPKFDRLFRWFSYSPLIILLSLLFFPSMLLVLSTFYMLMLTFLVPVLAIISWVKGVSAAWLFLLSWFFMVSGMLTYNLTVAGVIPLTFFTLHAGELGVSIEAILLSFALAYRIRTLEQQTIQQELESYEKIEAAFALVARSEAAKDSFLQSSSHQLKTPMHALLSHLQLLRNSVEEESNNVLLTNVIAADRSATELFFHIDNLLTYSQIVAGDLRPIIQRTHIQNECTRLRRVWNELFVTEDKRIECIIDSNVPTFLDLDWVHIRKIIRIAMENAFVATDVGLVIVNVKVINEQASPQLCCSIEDHGPGVQDEILTWFTSERIEDRWNEASSGLFICKNLNEVIEGQLKLENKPNGGAIFSLIAPIHGAESKKEQTIAPLTSYRVMVVDDVEINRIILCGMLEQLGIQAVCASSGENALKQLEHESVDLILMDCQMPGLSGQQTTQVLRTQKDDRANIRIVAVSANDSDLDRQSCFDAGMQDFMSKPVRIDDLHQKLKEWLG